MKSFRQSMTATVVGMTMFVGLCGAANAMTAVPDQYIGTFVDTAATNEPFDNQNRDSTTSGAPYGPDAYIYDVYGSVNTFSIQGAMVSRNLDGSVTFRVDTNYAGKPNPGALDTQYGSLFLGAGDPGITGINGEGDKYTDNLDRFSHALYMPADTPGGDIVTPVDTELYALRPFNDSGPVATHTSPLDPTDANFAQVKLSEYPTSGFRPDQAWTIDPTYTPTGGTETTTAKAPNSTGGTYAVSTGNYIEFVINGVWTAGVNGTLTTLGQSLVGSDGLTSFGYAMSCANDVIVAAVSFSDLVLPPVPLPGGLLLLLSGLLGVGFLGRKKIRKVAAVG